LQRDGHTLDGFVSQKTVALFIYLACHPYEHPRETLAALFWSETTTEQALKNLRTVLSSLQKQVGDYLIITRQSITITRIDDIFFDVWEFERHINIANSLNSRPSSPRKLQQVLEQALVLYKGDFLPSLKTENAPELETWLFGERDRLQTMMTNALFLAMNTSLKRKRYTVGIEHGRRLIAIEPFYEKAYRLLMMLYASANNRTNALQVYEQLVTILADELDTEPEAESVTLYQQIKLHRFQVISPPTITATLPAIVGQYVAVDAVIEQVMTKLDDPDCRMVTILGIGGVGKTQLAKHIARSRMEDYADGVFFVPLDALTGGEFVLGAVMNALQISHHDETRTPLQTVISHLKKRHCLLILDNFEQVLSAAVDIANLLAGCPFIQCLVTSREQLAIAGEHIIPLHGLPYHDIPEKNPAMHLFAVTAEQVMPNFSLINHHQAVRDICALVDGLPLGIVIAASWSQFLSPEDIRARMHDSLDFLTTHRRDLPERHRGINALLYSTWEMLTSAQQTVMMALSVFPSHFDDRAATMVAGAKVQVLSELVTKSLLLSDGDDRYSLHELLRRFTTQKADEAGHLPTIREAYHRYYSEWIDALYNTHLPTHAQLTAIDREYHNLWMFDGLSHEARVAYIAQLAKILPDYWFARGYHLTEGVALLREALPHVHGWHKANLTVRFGRLLAQTAKYAEARPMLEEGVRLSQAENDVSLEALALAELNRAVFALGEPELARGYLHRMVALYDNLPATDEVALREVFARAYSNLAVSYLQLAQLDEAEQYAQTGLQKQREAGNAVGEALCLNTLGIIALDRQQFQLAQHYFELALKIAYAIDHKRHQTIFSGNLAEALHRLGDFDGAFAMYIQTLHRAYAIDNRKTMLNVLEQLANVELDRQHAQESARLLGMALALRDSLALAIPPRQQAEFSGREARLREALGDADFHTHLQTGRSLTLEVFLEGI
jgi:predicted ATPase/DNA-binding SARP family transcriptional activator